MRPLHRVSGLAARIDTLDGSCGCDAQTLRRFVQRDRQRRVGFRRPVETAESALISAVLLLANARLGPIHRSVHELVGVQIAQLSLVHHRCADVCVARVPDAELGRLAGRQIDASLLDQLDVAADEFGLAEVESQPPMCASRVERKGGERGLLTHGGRVTAERCGRRRALQGDGERGDGAPDRKVGGLMRSADAARMGAPLGEAVSR